MEPAAKPEMKDHQKTESVESVEVGKQWAVDHGEGNGSKQGSHEALVLQLDLEELHRCGDHDLTHPSTPTGHHFPQH